MLNLLWNNQRKDFLGSAFIREEKYLVREADTVELTNHLRNIIYEEKLRLGYNVHSSYGDEDDDD